MFCELSKICVGVTNGLSDSLVKVMLVAIYCKTDVQNNECN